MIPKKIHAFWFGGKEYPELVKRCLLSWKKVLPDYEVVLWNESTYDVNKCEFSRQMFEKKKWAYLSDFARLDVLYEFGGIYMDVDLELRKGLDHFLDESSFIGFMFDCTLGTALIGAEPQNKHIQALRELYLSGKIRDGVPNNNVFTDYAIKNIPGFKLNNKLQRFNSISIFPKEWFEFPVLFGRKGGYSVHHFLGSWWRNDSRHENIKRLLKYLFGPVGYWAIRKVSHRKVLQISPYRGQYLRDRQFHV